VTCSVQFVQFVCFEVQAALVECSIGKDRTIMNALVNACGMRGAVRGVTGAKHPHA
jgi:hypothetical protein